MANEGKIIGGRTQGSKSLSKFVVEKHSKSKQITPRVCTETLSRKERRLLSKPNGKYILVNGQVCKTKQV